MYVISATPEDYVLNSSFMAVEMTKDKERAKKFDKDAAKDTLTILHYMGFEGLLIKL